MIKQYLVVILLATSQCIFAQENKNKFVLSGNANYSRSQQLFEYAPVVTSKLSGISYSGGIHAGYSISDNFAVGLFTNQNRNINHTAYDSPNSTESWFKSSGHSQSIGFFSRYQYLFIANKLGLLVQAHIGIQHGRWDSQQFISYPTSDEQIIREYGTSKQQFIDISPGLIYYINKRFSLETSLGYIGYGIEQRREIGSDYISKSRGIGMAFFSTIHLAFTYYFGLNKKQG